MTRTLRQSLLHALILTIAAAANARAQDPIVPPDAKVEKIFEGKFLTEGVTSAPDGTMYFSEITF
jgi:hypothetical protein